MRTSQAAVTTSPASEASDVAAPGKVTTTTAPTTTKLATHVGETFRDGTGATWKIDSSTSFTCTASPDPATLPVSTVVGGTDPRWTGLAAIALATLEPGQGTARTTATRTTPATTTPATATTTGAAGESSEGFSITGFLSSLVSGTTPSPPTGATTYVVKPGDTFPIIAALLTNDASRASELTQANPTMASPKPGATLTLPTSWQKGVVATGGSSGIVDAALEWLREVTMGAPATLAPAPTTSQASATQPPASAPAPSPTTKDPLALAVSKVGKVAYTNAQHLKGSKDLTTEETQKLLTGSDDIEVADCCTFITWTLAASGHLSDPATKKKLIAAINMTVPLEHESLGADIAAGSDSIKGPAAAFEAAKIGVEIKDHATAKPADYIQIWHADNSGHAMMIHRAFATGAAVIGGPGGALPVKGSPPATPTPMGFDGAPIDFIIDENTDPTCVGPHHVTAVENIGCNTVKKDSEGNAVSPGVFTEKAETWDEIGTVYIGRLDDSKWSKGPLATADSVKLLGTSPSPATPATDTVAPTATSSPGIVDSLTAAFDRAVTTLGRMLGSSTPAPSEAPTESPSPAAQEPQPFVASKVRGYDFTVYPDASIVCAQTDRTFKPGSKGYDAVHAEIVAVYPSLPY